MKNKFLEKLLEEKNINNEEIWQSIIENDGSVAHLKNLNEDEKKNASKQHLKLIKGG